MTARMAVLVAILLGITTGFMTIHSPLAARWESVFFWGAIGLAYGALIAPSVRPLWPGAAYGFCMSMAFFIFGFAGTAAQLPRLLLLALGFSLLGALGGIASVWAGAWLRQRIGKAK